MLLLLHPCLFHPRFKTCVEHHTLQLPLQIPSHPCAYCRYFLCSTPPAPQLASASESAMQQGIQHSTQRPAVMRKTAACSINFPRSILTLLMLSMQHTVVMRRLPVSSKMHSPSRSMVGVLFLPRVRQTVIIKRTATHSNRLMALLIII